VAAIIKLEDGRALKGSSMGVSGMLDLISLQISEQHLDLKRWLADKAERCAPFIDFDVRGLPGSARKEFWRAADQALVTLIEQKGPANLQHPNAYASYCLNQLLQMKRSIAAGEPPLTLSHFDHVLPFDGRTIDLNELWENGEST
jgi:hypothetical protein